MNRDKKNTRPRARNDKAGASPGEPVFLGGIHYGTGEGIRIEIRDGYIHNIISAPEEDNSGLIIAPGLVDNQVNGYMGTDFSDGDFDESDVLRAATALWKTGVTTFLPTLITNSHKVLVRNFSILSQSLRNEKLQQCIPGFHLEGPYISPLDGYRGAHPAEYVRKPSWKEFTEYSDAAGGRIMQLTMAPELEGSKNFIRNCIEAGTEVAIGHSAASADEIKEAVDYGVRLSVHLGNGCANLIHRHNNPIWPQLADDRLIPSIIADGHHLTPEEIKVFFRVKGPDRMILTSDMTSLAGLPPGIYHFGGSKVHSTAGGLLLNVEQNCLAGASAPLIHDVGHLVDVTGCTLSEALHMAGRNVARIYGLDDRGELREGQRADIILIEKQDNTLAVRETWLAGERVQGPR